MYATRTLPLAALALLTAALALMSSPNVEAAPGDLYDISGRVCATPLPACAPLRGAIVTMQPYGQFTQASLADGTFSLTGVRVGTYALSVSFACTTTECYQSLSVTVLNADLNVQLVPCGDTDGDGMCNAWESTRACMNQNTIDDAADPDADSVPNIVEYELGSNPCNVDTDADGCSDIEELDVMKELGGDRNPLDSADFFDPSGDKLVDLTDALLILNHFGHGPASDATDNALDRFSPDPEKPHRTVYADDGIDLTDAITNLSSFGDDCNDLP